MSEEKLPTLFDIFEMIPEDDSEKTELKEELNRVREEVRNGNERARQAEEKVRHPTERVMKFDRLDNKCCGICTDEYESGDDIRMLGCGHYFHQACVDEWFKNSNICPQCRKDRRS
jgi:hypothetical protein